eukprot:12880222-Prorocentrum_lima.AAC.1
MRPGSLSPHQRWGLRRLLRRPRGRRVQEALGLRQVGSGAAGQAWNCGPEHESPAHDCGHARAH